MAKATSKTISYDIQSPTTQESRVVIERCFIKSTKVGGRYITASKEYALFDTNGRRYERISDSVMRCLSTNERFHVVGQADRIRKASV
jgi:hypothetical protein